MAPTIKSIRAKHHSSSTDPLTFVLLERGDAKGTDGAISYESLILRGLDVPAKELERAERTVQAEDVCSLQFTSGTTGKPKVAMLTHR